MSNQLNQIVLYQLYFVPDGKRQMQLIFGYAPGSSAYHHIAIDYWTTTGFNLNTNLSLARMPQYLTRYLEAQFKDPHNIFESLRQQLKAKATKSIGVNEKFRIVTATAAGVPIPSKWSPGHAKAQNWSGVMRMNFMSRSGILIQALNSVGYLEGMQFPISMDEGGDLTALQRYYHPTPATNFTPRTRESSKVISIRIRGRQMEKEFSSNPLWAVAARNNRSIKKMINEWSALRATVKEWEAVPKELFKYLKQNYVYENIPRK